MALALTARCGYRRAMLRRIASFLLILMLLVSGQSFAAARGQVMQGDQVVLCIGGAVVVTVIPGEEGDSRHAHLCPDMVLSLLAGLSVDAVLPQPDGRARDADTAISALSLTLFQTAAPRVRDPPAGRGFV